jgi:POT family proton-dependent oligopeptide transporter
MGTKETAAEAFASEARGVDPSADDAPGSQARKAPPTDGGSGDAPQGHPSGLYVLFGAEAWERFSYYGMRALLVLYLTKALGVPKEHALEIYGLYTGLVYLTPLLGGYLADKILGRRKAVLIGGILMGLGQIFLMFPATLTLALGLLIAGNGFFKPNISTMVGGLYREGDTRRDGAFTIFYMGINLGAFMSPIVCGFLGENVSWALGFGSAALGMALGLAQFVYGQGHLGGTGLPPSKKTDEKKEIGGSGPYREGALPAGIRTVLAPRDYIDVLIWCGSTAALVYGVLFAWNFVGPFWTAAPGAVKLGLLLAAVSVVFFQLYKGTSSSEKKEVSVIIILVAFNIFFWMGFEQAGGTMTLFADEQTNRHVGGLGMLFISAFVFLCAYNFRRSTKSELSGQMLWLTLTGGFVLLAVGIFGLGAFNLATGKTTLLPASLFQAINPLLIVALAPTFSNMWSKLDSGKFKSSTPTKMAIGMVLLGVGFMVLYVGQKLALSSGTQASAAWLAGVYFIHTLGELCLSPIGLSMVTKLAPPRVTSLAMGLWLFSSAVANYLAGILESLLTKVNVPIYGFLIVSSVGPAVLLLALTPLLKKWMHGKA